jgi:hypothetical protein
MKIKLSRTGRRLSILVGMLTAMIASGCASPDTARLVARTAKTPFYTVTIKFENGCPKLAVPPTQSSCPLSADGLCVSRGKAVLWVSDPAGTAFEVYFDPFVGRPYASHGLDEKTSPVMVRSDSALGDYKYGVFGVNCKGGDPILDPPMRVER